MAALAYAASKDPKGAGVVLLALGLFLFAGGAWFALTQGGTIPWVMMGAGAFIAGAAWAIRRGLR
jgi:hypothetical protein